MSRFARVLIFAKRSLHICLNLPIYLFTSGDICPQILARVLIFAHNRSSQILWYLPTDLRTNHSMRAPPVVRASLNLRASHSLRVPACWYFSLIFANKYSFHVLWYLPPKSLHIFGYLPTAYLRMSSDICPLQIFACHFNANISPKCWIGCLFFAFATCGWVLSHFFNLANFWQFFQQVGQKTWIIGRFLFFWSLNLKFVLLAQHTFKHHFGV